VSAEHNRPNSPQSPVGQADAVKRSSSRVRVCPLQRNWGGS